MRCSDCIHLEVCKYPDDDGCLKYEEKRPTCKTCTMWDANHQYCTGWESFMEAEDYCSEHEDKEGEAE